MLAEKFIVVRRARVGPALLFIASIWIGFAGSAWCFLAIPFVALGWLCAVPNLNLANGLLAYLSMIVGFVVLQIHVPSGTAIAVGAAAGFYFSALEMRVMAKPFVPKIDSTRDP
ncbi:hypothetical protein [Haloferula sp. BvORR071]|uniref:hypothetical protein n=1 Tax=Haloferula sp. BvORR071 TaxID=1396141 RepID=UPI0022410128|nr:hypothetical protein [Haloferula sp. BvORR071]